MSCPDPYDICPVCKALIPLSGTDQIVLRLFVDCLKTSSSEDRQGIPPQSHIDRSMPENRQILKDFEFWAKDLFVIGDKRDSDVAGSKGNRERFYLLKVV